MNCSSWVVGRIRGLEGNVDGDVDMAYAICLAALLRCAVRIWLQGGHTSGSPASDGPALSCNLGRMALEWRQPAVSAGGCGDGPRGLVRCLGDIGSAGGANSWTQWRRNAHVSMLVSYLGRSIDGFADHTGTMIMIRLCSDGGQ